MIIDGREIAKQILERLKLRVEKIKEKGITPKLAVILMGDEKSSVTYVRQKELKAKEIGAKTQIFRFGQNVGEAKIKQLVKKLDADKSIHGVILQRPAPKSIDAEKLEELISPQKEVDGFGKHPIYPVPVAQAVFLLLKKTYESLSENAPFQQWVKLKNTVILGKGETAGQPIINHLIKLGVEPLIIDSKTQDKDSLLKKADIIISAVGKTIINSANIKKGAILIGVGMHTENGKLCGDYDEENIKGIASFYTPTPGGVGPVNVAMLLQNLVDAAEALTLD